MRKLITAKELAKLSKPGRYAVGHGAYLQISEWNTRAWVFRYRRNGKAHHVGLGSAAYVSLHEVRERAFEFRRNLIRGIDPLAAKRAAAREVAQAAQPRPTFAQCAGEYIASHESTWRGPSSREQWEASLKKHVFPKIGGMAVADIDTAAVLSVLDPMRLIRETASRVKQRIALILAWAAVRNLRPQDNPARQRLLPPHKTKQVHFAALDYRALPAFMAALRARPEASARSLELQVLTATRPSEASGARWPEIDLDHQVWVIGGERVKGGDDHRVALSKRAVKLLAGLPREAGADNVFIGSNISARRYQKRTRELLKRMGHAVTLHGFRSSFRTWAEEQTAFPHAVVEAALGHKVLSQVERAYQRSDLLERRQQLMQAWADYCGKPAAKSGKVVPLRGVL